MILLLMGAPGAGKGTQADLLAESRGYRKLSTGDALRIQIKQGTEIGKEAKSYMDSGKLVPDQVLLGILQTEIAASKGKTILLDGYPRNRAQALSLIELYGSAGVRACVHLDVAQDDLIGRISGRRTCGACGASFHLISSPPKISGVCDRCKGTLEQRSDDAEDKVKVRLGVYEGETKPVLDVFESMGLYHRVDGSGSTQEVFSRICEVLDRLGL